MNQRWGIWCTYDNHTSHPRENWLEESEGRLRGFGTFAEAHREAQRLDHAMHGNPYARVSHKAKWNNGD
jgi:hypothetical protein